MHCHCSLPGRTALTGALIVLGASTAQAHVTLLGPNGGEQLKVGSQFTIEWKIDIVHNLQNWDLWYRTSMTGNWKPIATDLPPGDPTVNSKHEYLWTIPDDPSDQVRVRVRMDNSGTDYYDISNADLTIVPECCGDPYCNPKDNSTGMPGLLQASGSDVAMDNNLILVASQLPLNQFGYPLLSETQASIPVASGILCLGGQIGRLRTNIFNSGATGSSGAILLDILNLPNPPGGSVMAGQTWNFQVWFRDPGTSNFTNGVTVAFQ